MPIDIFKADVVGLISSIENQGKTVSKEWGREIILPGDGYTTKIMEVKPGFQCSIHFHQKKNETFVLIEGSLDVAFWEPDSTKHSMRLDNPLSALVLPACTPHTFSVPKDQGFNSIFLESSTPDDPSDSYRLTRSGMNE